MKANTIVVLAALLAGTCVETRAEMASIAIAPGTGVVTVTPRWDTNFDPAGFHYKSQDLSLGGGAAQFYAIKGGTIPAAGDGTAFVSYGATSGTATEHADIGVQLTPDSYSALTSADPAIQTFGAANFYTIHHRATGDYFTAIVPGGGTPTVSDLKPMSGPGGPDTAGGTGYFALTFAAPSVAGSGTDKFYYLRNDTSNASIFGVLDPSLAGSSTDKFTLGSGYIALEYGETDLGYGAQRFYYLREDPETHNTIIGTFNGVSGARSDIANLGGAFTAFSFVPGSVFGTNNFYATGTLAPDAQSISFAPIADRNINDGSFTVSPSASSLLPIKLTTVPGSTGAAAITGPVGGVFTITPTAPGVITLQATQAGQTTPTPYAQNMMRQSFTATGPTLLAITQQPQPKSVAIGGSASFTVAAVGTTALGYQWRKDGTNILIGANPTANSTTLTINNVQNADYAVYDVVVTNASGSIVSDPAPLTPLAAPVITSPDTATGVVGTAFTYNIVADGIVTNYGATGLPPGLVVDSNTGAITGTPTEAGTFVATLRATNITGSDLQSLTITIAALPVVPTITSSEVASGTVGTPFTYTITAAGLPTTFGATDLPPGLGVDSATGIISGTPTTAGTFVVTLQAANAVGTGTGTLTITLAPAPVAPTITSANTASGTVGALFVYSIVASPSPTSYFASGLPAGLTLNTSTGTIVGIPVLPGVSNVTLYATNGVGTGSAPLVITVVPAPAVPVITSAASASGTVGVPFSFAIVASGIPTNYGATSLPPGLSVNAGTGVISGTPTVAGTYAATVRASNDVGTGSATLTITIASPNVAPSFTVQPASVTVSPGGTATFTAAVSGQPAPTLQWRFNGTNIAGATGATLTVSNARLADAGAYSVVATNSAGSATSNSASLSLSYSRIVNFSARAFSGVGENALLMGFVIAGNNKTVLARGVGPTLANYSIAAPLMDPLLTIEKNGVGAVASNDDWQVGNNATLIASTADRVGAFPLPSGSKDSALIATLNDGSHVASFRRTGGGTGVALAELYDADDNLSARLLNASALMNVGTGENSLVCGFAIGGNKPKTVLVRAVGPTLATVGVPSGLLADPQLTVRRGGTVVGTNNDWGTANGSGQLASAMAQVGAFPLPSTSKDAALLLTLDPDAYNVEVTGVGNTTGIAIVEVYDVQ